MASRWCWSFALLLCCLPAFPASEDIEFTSHGVTLSGSLVLPENQPILSAVVFIHGSGKQSRNLDWAKRFADAGIAALVYDKRGVGKSGGEYEGQQSVSGPNISLLADDAVAALDALTRLASMKGIPAGFAGISQAGWIAPLAARRSRVAQFQVFRAAGKRYDYVLFSGLGHNNMEGSFAVATDWIHRVMPRRPASSSSSPAR